MKPITQTKKGLLNLKSLVSLKGLHNLRNPLKNLKTNSGPFKHLYMSLIFSDFVFIVLSFYVFYRWTFGFIIAIPACFALYQYTGRYLKTPEERFTQTFVDFLNLINSHLSTGTTFEKALIQFEVAPHMSFAQPYEKLKTTIQMGSPIGTITHVLYDIFPIADAKLFSDIVASGLKLGVNPSFITSRSINLLSYKQQILSEMNRILYQKKLEQTILVFAPLCIILLIMTTSPTYLDILYETGFGRMIMTGCFSLIVIMKLLSERLVQIEVN